MIRLIKNVFLTGIGWLLLTSTQAQAPKTMSSSDILAGLQKLKVLGSVLYVAAHPDDENTRLLAYLANEKRYRTGYLSLTRGDGGQNLIGNEQGVELGLIRTQELLAARRIDGGEQFFSRAYDFGFSKSTDETLRTWDREKVLADAVWVIRSFQPDVIITRFPRDKRAGHGHHSASAVIAEEAFIAAGDPNRFPEQLKYVQPWKAKRLLWNTFNFGSNNTISEDQFKIEVGMYNPLLGEGYGEIAAESRSQHKSQGFGVARQRGSMIEYFLTTQGSAPVKDLMDDVNISWNRVNGGTAIQKKIDDIIAQFSFYHPGESVKALVDLYKTINALDNSYWKQQKAKEVIKLIEACSGLWMEAFTDKPEVKQGDDFKINVTINNRNGCNIISKGVRFDGFDTSFNITLSSNQNLNFSKQVRVANGIQPTQPYWLQKPMKPGYFDVRDQLLIGNADNKPAFSAHFYYTIEGENFEIVKPVQQKFTDPVKGELYEPLAILPVKEDKQTIVRHIQYDHIPRITYFKKEEPFPVFTMPKITGKKIGYIEGAGDKVVPALQLMGYDVTILSDKDLATANLTGYQAIITGVRAYNVKESLSGFHDKLMKYVENGGNLIVQYNTSNQLGTVKGQIGPYPFNISRNRITEEDAQVRFVNPQHPILNYPNKITEKDFEGWIQERSIYHAQNWDSRYQTIFAMHDTGEKDDEGSLIVTKYGKGHFVYTGLVFFRELPAGVAGAYRLFANIISLK